MRRRAILVAGLTFLGANAAQAHAILIESTPAIGAKLAAGPTNFTLRFNSLIDRARSRLTLIRADKSQSVLPILNEGSEEFLNTRVDLEAGSYTIRWQVLAVDGHITRGDVAFTVEAR
jgi:methionine-rich copper-binding protein CopC